MDLFEVRMSVAEMFDNVANSFSEPIKQLIQTKVFFGGFVFKCLVLDEKVNDWDFWFKDKESGEKFKELLAKETYTIPSPLTNRDKLKLSKIMITTDNAFTLNFPNATVQFITMETGTPKEVIGKFDFLHTQCYYDGEKAELSCPTQFIVGKVLRYNPEARTPLSALKRAFKFGSQGWSIKDNEIEAMIKSVTGLDWKNPEVVKKQVRGMYSKTVDIDRDEDADEAPVRQRRPTRPIFTDEMITGMTQPPAPQTAAIQNNEWAFTGVQDWAPLTVDAVNQAAGTVTLINN